MNTSNSVYHSIIGSTADSFMTAIEDDDEDDFMYVSCLPLQTSHSNVTSTSHSDRGTTGSDDNSKIDNDESDIEQVNSAEILSRFLLSESRQSINNENTHPIQRVQQEMHRLDACISKRNFDGAIEAHKSIAHAYKEAATEICGHSDDSFCQSTHDEQEFSRSLMMLSHLHIHRAKDLSNVIRTKQKLAQTKEGSNHIHGNYERTQSPGGDIDLDAFVQQKDSVSDMKTNNVMPTIHDDNYPDNYHAHNTHSKADTTQTSPSVYDSLDNERDTSNSVASFRESDESNPVDDMLAMERELNNLNMTLTSSRTISPSQSDSYSMIIDNEDNTVKLQQPATKTMSAKQSRGLESSWWGGSASHLGQSIAISASSFLPSRNGINTKQEINKNSEQKLNSSSVASTNTKQVLNLLDSLRTLSEENTALLKQIDDAKAARIEADSMRTKMIQFKVDYGKRFSSLKAALDKFRTEYPTSHSQGNDQYKNQSCNPVENSNYSKEKARSEKERARQRERLIRKMDQELRRLKEEGKKKDVILKKYENFYKEVKARSAQKALEKQQQFGKQNRNEQT